MRTALIAVALIGCGSSASPPVSLVAPDDAEVDGAVDAPASDAGMAAEVDGDAEVGVRFDPASPDAFDAHPIDADADVDELDAQPESDMPEATDSADVSASADAPLDAPDAVVDSGGPDVPTVHSCGVGCCYTTGRFTRVAGDGGADPGYVLDTTTGLHWQTSLTTTFASAVFSHSCSAEVGPSWRLPTNSELHAWLIGAPAFTDAGEFTSCDPAYDLHVWGDITASDAYIIVDSDPTMIGVSVVTYESVSLLPAGASAAASYICVSP